MVPVACSLLDTASGNFRLPRWVALQLQSTTAPPCASVITRCPATGLT